MGEEEVTSVQDVLKGSMRYCSLPGSGHPLNSALGTESVQKGQRGKGSLAKLERKGRIKARKQFTGWRNHRNKITMF